MHAHPMALTDIYHSLWLAAVKSPSKPRAIWLSCCSSCSWAIWLSSCSFWLRASAIWLASCSRLVCALAACCSPRMTGHSDTAIFSWTGLSNWPKANAATIASWFCCQCSQLWSAVLHSMAKDRHLRLFIPSTLDDLPKTSVMQSIQLKLGNSKNPKYIKYAKLPNLSSISHISLCSIPGTLASCAYRLTHRYCASPDMASSDVALCLVPAWRNLASRQKLIERRSFPDQWHSCCSLSTCHKDGKRNKRNAYEKYKHVCGLHPGE